MAKLVIIAEDRLRELVEGAVRQAVADILSEATSIDVPVPAAAPGTKTVEASALVEAPSPKAEVMGTVTTPQPSENGTRYVIGRATGQFSYADVVAIELPKLQFSIDEAWEAIKDKIDTDSSRARGSTRRSLDTDDRFERVPDRKGIWYRRIDMEQVNMGDT